MTRKDFHGMENKRKGEGQLKETVSSYVRFRPAAGALPRGGVAEILGPCSSGRTSVIQSMLATATAAGEVAAYVDSCDSFDPGFATRAGVKLEKLLWVQCAHRVDVALKAADMLLHSGGFGLIVLDLCDAPVGPLNRIPTSSWYRFQRAVENTQAVLVVLACQAMARACAKRQLGLEQRQVHWRGDSQFRTIDRLSIEAISRKPFDSRTVEVEALAEV